ncbi:AAA domain-containing protein, putative AbiEii toxin, Type IV TA system [Reichenbachiella agariperforans]|uniref:AAA domain-containing protein, putative AbiEii toxin, Type IV TA system n=1 Tax=Reichenbachiella agariperforans TaxID=156994 RepID=A0A1M6R3P8_REIAG|nr:AAA family ATPase [Reichenbachiella agariperforans]SHK26948.1 AAA domain-containing protein, putative AbiEii toxin, Type IV TA system [Reichenbachiella agariperforans]
MLNLQNIKAAKNNLLKYDPSTFSGNQNSYRYFLNKVKINNFRHIDELEFSMDHAVTVISGTNKIGKTSILLLIACSHENFMKYDSTKPDTVFRRHTWRDVLNFTSYESAVRSYSYELFWRVGIDPRQGEGKRAIGKQSWTGLGKASKDLNRINAQIRDKQVRLIDLDRLLPARNFSNSLIRKIARYPQERVHEDIEQAFNYVFEIPNPVQIHKIGSHINKLAYLITPNVAALNEPYSSYNAASGEESLLNILVDIFEAPNDSLILIDELEAAIHPNVQRRLADIIQYVSWHHKKQFILTTHSPSLISSFPQVSRKFIDIGVNGKYEAISSISVNAAFSKMDSRAYPLLQLYCEDQEAKFIIQNILIKVNQTRKHFDRLVNIIVSGAINEVKGDYERHKKNYPQMRLKIGYCCVFDGDYKNDPKYSHYHQHPTEHTFFLYPYTAPEKFLIKSYLNSNPNAQLTTALNYSDHHALFQEMVSQGLAANEDQALNLCWQSFIETPEYSKLETELTKFLIDTVKFFSAQSD